MLNIQLHAMLISSIYSCVAFTAVIRAVPDPTKMTGPNIRPTADALSTTDLMLNTSAAGYKAGSPQCAEVYGHPPLSSCMEALSLIPRNNQQETFGQRPRRFVDHVMPFALVSCKQPPASRLFPSWWASSLYDNRTISDIGLMEGENMSS